MQSALDNGTPITIAEVAGSSRGLVIAPDIFGLRPLFTDMVERFASEWGMTTIAVEPFPGRDLGADLEPRYAAVPTLADDVVLGDLVAAAERTGCDSVGLIGFCMGGMYCFKAASTGRFDRIASFYGMIRLPEPWRSPGQGEPLDLVVADPESVLAVIGELGLLDDGPRSAGARALSVSEVLEIPFEAVREMLDEEPSLLWNAARMLAQRLRAMDEVLADSVFLDVTGRTAKKIVELSAGREEFVLPVTQEELAGMVGASRERVNKAIASFARLGWLEQHERNYRIIERDRLENRAR